MERLRGMRQHHAMAQASRFLSTSVATGELRSESEPRLPPLIAPVSLETEIAIAHAILSVHSSTAAIKRSVPGQPLAPVTLAEAWSALRAGGHSVMPFTVVAIADRLREAQFIHQCGYPGAPPLGGAYWSFPVLSARQKRGDLFLTAALGWRFLLARTERSVAMIEARTSKGDLTCGSGLLLADGVVLTNAHVVRDASAERVLLGDDTYRVREVAHDPAGSDVALVRIEGASSALADLSVREPEITERVLTLGHPPVPFARSTSVIAHSGEVCGRAVHSGTPFALVSAIVRPGNSGGPVFAADGRLVGIVSRSFERDREGNERSAPLPHFGCVPASVLREAVARIDPGVAFPWEDYEQ